MIELLNNADIYGWQFQEIAFDDKFDIIKDLYEFKRATIYDSCIRNELYLIDETKGIHTSGSGWRICDLKPVYEECSPWIYDEPIRFVGYKTVTNESLKDYVESHKEECEKWLEEHIDLNEYKKRIENKEKYRRDKCSHYYQLTPKDKGKSLEYYIENTYSDGYARITSTPTVYGFNIEFNGIVLGNDKTSPLESILSFMLVNRDLFKDFKKLNNGYVFNNDYYDSLEDILFHIEECIKEKNLYEKFMNDGLSSEDLKQ